jgi:RNA polymerase sigma-70 factor (ECF subfamily)
MSRDRESLAAEFPREVSLPREEESTDLLRRARRGDRSAVDALFSRLFPWLRRRTRGRLPRWARGVLDTSDVVQDVLLHSIRLISGFESPSSVAFRAYLLRAVDHRIRDEMRRVGRRDTHGGLEEDKLPAADGPSPLQQLIDNEAWQRYLRALKRMTSRERRLLVGRGELGYSFKQLALIDDRASAEAARKALRRALVRLSTEMDA